MGWPVVELWVASSNTDADVFVYLEDYDPKADKARCAVNRILVSLVITTDLELKLGSQRAGQCTLLADHAGM